MAWSPQLHSKIRRLNELRTRLKQRFASRDQAIDLLTLAVVCQEHVLLVGPPGTAKSQIISTFANQIQARSFQYLLTRFTEPSEIFGPLDLQKFMGGVYWINTQRMLPEAEIAFLDEVFEGSSAILNTLLTLVNERIFFNGPEPKKASLVSLIGASNRLPDDDVLAAFSDRFLLRLMVEPVAEDQLGELLRLGMNNEIDRIKRFASSEHLPMQVSTELPVVDVADLRALNCALVEVERSVVTSVYEQVMRQLRASSVVMSDRRIVHGLKLVCGATLLRGSDRTEPRDLWPLLHTWAQPEDQAELKEILAPHLGEDESAQVEQVSEDDVIAQLQILEHDMARTTTRAGLDQFLRQVNSLRNAVISKFGHNSAILGRIDVLISSAMERYALLETSRVQSTPR